MRARLKQGTATFADLLAVLPKERGQTAAQRTRACSNGLTRLRLKKAIK